MHDAVIADRQGVPAVSVMTSAFVDAADLMIRVHGATGHRFAVIEHPISSATGDGLQARAEAAVDQALEVLLAT